MQNKKFLFTSFIFLELFAIALTAQPNEITSSYFPLKIGNQWSYTNQSNTTFTQKIVDTTRINGYLYYGMQYGESSISTLYRISNDSVFVIDTINHKNESPLYYLKANIGDTLNIHSGYECDYGPKILLVGKEDTISTLSGTYTHCYHFKHTKVCIDAGMFDSWLAKDIGTVKYIRENYFGVQTWTLDSCTILTSVEHANSDFKISSYVLFDNYPNPFNPTTTICYQLPKQSKVVIRICDILGREISQLVNEVKSAGKYSIVFDGDNLSSGVYFYQLITDEKVISKKFVLIK